MTTVPADLFSTPGAAPKDDFEKVDTSGILEQGNRRRVPHPVTGNPTWMARASSFGGHLEDKFTLNEWTIAMAVIGVSRSEDLLAKAQSRRLPEMKDRGKGWWTAWAQDGHAGMDRIGSAAKANLGTAIHAWTDRLDSGEIGLENVPERWRAHCAKYLDLHKTAGLSPALGMAERLICLPDLHTGVTGRFDRLREDAHGSLIVDDLKTGNNVPLGLGEIAIQEACYANAPYIWDDENQIWEYMPANVRKDIALITNVPVDRPDESEIIVVDIEWGWQAAQVVAWILSYRNRAKRMIGSPKGSLRLSLATILEKELRDV